MPTLEQNQTVEPVVELNESQKALLLREIALYESLVADLEDTKEDIEAMKKRLDRLRVEMGDGAKKLIVDAGISLTLVEGTSSSLDKKGLMKAFSITPKQWAGFMRTKPKKPYLLITTPSSEAKEKAAKASPRDDRDEEDDRE
jgi:hypothetical protein